LTFEKRRDKPVSGFDGMGPLQPHESSS